jgi:NodT family efflux transporter outer membrane factor (OMF) lipoprotein
VQTNSISVAASWIPDFWGGVRRSVEASKASAQSSQALVESASLAARSTLAQAYFQLRIADLQKRIYEETIVAYKRALQITRNQVKAGIVTELDVSQAETLLSSTEALSIDIDVSRNQLEHAIAVLIGEMPANFSIDRDTSTTDQGRFVEQSRIYQLITNLPPIPVGIPAQLLERRPDIASAERQMEAANARIGVAQAAFFPVPVLSAGGGYQASSVSNLLNANNFVWSLGPSLAQSIFDGGTRLAATRQAMAAYDQSVANYRQTVLTAFQNVEDNLISIALLNDEIKKQQRAVQYARRAADISMNQYTAGVVSYLTVVTAQASLLTNERNLVTLYNREIASHVNLITALGGYWDANLLNTTGDIAKNKP